MQSKLLTTLGLCRRAGRLSLGFDESAAAIQGKKAHLLVLASDLSPKSAKEITRLAERHNIDTVRLTATMDELWQALGKRAGILTITEPGLAGTIAALSRSARQSRQDEEEKSV